MRETPRPVDFSDFAAKSRIGVWVGEVETLFGAVAAALLALVIITGCIVALTSPLISVPMRSCF
jgi:hypothetical protein